MFVSSIRAKAICTPVNPSLTTLQCGLKGTKLRGRVAMMNSKHAECFSLNLCIANILVLTICMSMISADIYATDAWYFAEALCKKEFRRIYVSHHNLFSYVHEVSAKGGKIVGLGAYKCSHYFIVTRRDN